MSKVRLYGDTSGYVDLKAPDVAGDVTITLPNTTGPFATETYVDAAVAAIPGIGSNVVQTVKTDTFSTTSTTFGAITGMSVTITPSSATSLILVLVDLRVAADTDDVNGHLRIMRGATPIYIGDADGSRTRGLTSFGKSPSSVLEQASAVYLDNPATTSATTYSVEIRASVAFTVAVNRTIDNLDSAARVRGASSITVIEVAA
jgi:hypothetical protein